MQARSSAALPQGFMGLTGATAARPRADAFAAVRAWLWFVAFLVLAIIVVGGATRLTGSGLSITEWRPLMGAIPPFSEAAWLAEFEKYRAIPQYQLLNRGMSLGEFKYIYWWEWGHRQLGRFIGVAYLLPWLWFVVRGAVRGRLALWLLGVGALGGFQGAIGWIMVASGLKDGMIAVAPVKLALHLTTACLILTCLVWTVRALRPEASSTVADAGAILRARLIVALVLVQIALGALVAGSKSGLVYNTWPLMDGALIPHLSSLFAATPWIANFAENSTLIQFNHRLMAYLLFAAALWHWLALRGTGRDAWKALHLLLAVLVQAALGIVTLLLAVPLWAGLLHQLLAALLLVSAVIHAEGLGRRAP
jgi:cytochrome c oxidase assembly protein subunit 15